MKQFRGTYPLILTPFKENEDLDLDALKVHIDWLIDKGAPGLFLTGSWGEYGQLSDEERMTVYRVGIEHVAGRVPVIAGVGREGQTTRETIAFAKYAQAVGADGLMIKQYLYIDRSERWGPIADVDLREGLFEYFGTVREAVDIPIMLYNVFGMVTASPRIQAELAQQGIIQYVKECAGLPLMQQTIALAGDALTVYCGMEDSAFPSFVLGAGGWCSGTATIIPEAAVALFNLVAEGQIAKAKALWYQMVPLTAFLESGKGIQLLKYASCLRGVPVGTARKSRADLTEGEKNNMQRLLQGMGVI